MNDFESWRCARDENKFCPPEGCPAYYGCAREHGWLPGIPTPEPCKRYVPEEDKKHQQVAIDAGETTVVIDTDAVKSFTLTNPTKNSIHVSHPGRDGPDVLQPGDVATYTPKGWDKVDGD